MGLRNLGVILGLGLGLYVISLPVHAQTPPPLTATLVAGVHPGWDLRALRTSGFNPKVGGLAVLPSGQLLIADWGTHFKSDGSVSALDANVPGAAPKVIASGLNEPLGLTVVEGKIYVLEKQQLSLLVDANGDGVYEARTKVAGGWEFDAANNYDFSFGLVFHEGFFYASMGVGVNPGGLTTEKQGKWRGTLLKMGLDGTTEVVADGFRMANGLGIGPENTLFVTDNQGSWVPTSKLIAVKPGRHYGHKVNPPSPFQAANVVESPPAIWFPHGEIGFSPAQPILLKSGEYAGQMLVADMRFGGILRAALEKVGGEWQGSVMQFSMGFEAGPNRLAFGADGTLFVGGIGGERGGWDWNGKKTGLQAIKPNGKRAFEIKAIRAIKTGFVVEFTDTVNPSVTTLTNWSLSQWDYPRALTYYVQKSNKEALNVTEAKLSADGKSVTLTVPGLKAFQIVQVRVDASLKSVAGNALWSNEGFYTLNTIPEYVVLPTSIAGHAAKNSRSVMGHPRMMPLRGFYGLDGKSRTSVSVPLPNLTIRER